MKIKKTAIICLILVISGSISAQFNNNNSATTYSDTIFKQDTSYISHNNFLDSIINFAKNYMGLHYIYGGTTPKGFDCSGFMLYIFKNFGIHLPRTASAQFAAYQSVAKENLRKGDLIFFESRKRNNRIGHVGMVVSDSIENNTFKFIHSSVKGVKISSLDQDYYAKRYLSACRIINTDTVKIELHKAKIVKSIDVFHTVKKGETLFAIAKEYSTTVDSIRLLNNLADNHIKIGQNLLIRQNQSAITEKNEDIAFENINAKTETKEPIKNENNPKTIIYKVKKGDNLYNISKRYGINLDKLKKDNNLINNNLRIGQTLKIIKK